MKAVPLLAITNAVTLALVLLLYFQQDDSQVGQRASSRQAASVDEDAIRSSILADLRAEFADRMSAPGEKVNERATLPADEAGAGNAAGPRPEGATAGTDSEQPELSGEFMETFRGNVRKAIELNREEDRVNQEMERIDRLITENKIGRLDARQKKAVAATLLKARDNMPNVWRQFRDNPELREMPREDRAKLIRVEYQKLRDETQKALEEVVPAADAKTILDEGMRGAGGFRGMGGGDGTPRTPSRRVGGGAGGR